MIFTFYPFSRAPQIGFSCCACQMLGHWNPRYNFSRKMIKAVCVCGGKKTKASLNVENKEISEMDFMSKLNARVISSLCCLFMRGEIGGRSVCVCVFVSLRSFQFNQSSPEGAQLCYPWFSHLHLHPCHQRRRCGRNFIRCKGKRRERDD